CTASAAAARRCVRRGTKAMRRLQEASLSGGKAGRWGSPSRLSLCSGRLFDGLAGARRCLLRGGRGLGGRCLADALGLEARDEVAHLRVDDVAPAAAREDAVVAGAGHVVVELAILGDAGAQAMRGLGLAGAGDVVELAFDRQQRRGPDVLRA